MVVAPDLALKWYTDQDAVRPDLHDCKRWSIPQFQTWAETQPQPPEHDMGLMLQQWAMLYSTIRMGGFVMWHSDMGTGKSRAALFLVSWMRQLGHRPAMVLVPNKINVWSWLDEARKCAPHLTGLFLTDQTQSAKRTKFLFDTPCDFVVATYAGFYKKAATTPKRVESLRQRFGMCILDEIPAVRNPGERRFDQKIYGGKMHRAVKHMTRDWPIRVGATATPMGRYPEVLWGPFNLIDHGRTLGPTQAMFEAAFFTRTQDVVTGREKLHPRRDLDAYLHRVIRGGAIRYSKRECFQLPPIIPQVLRFTPTTKQREYIDRFKDPNNRESSYVRARQVTSGLLVMGDERIKLPNQPRLDVLSSWISQLPGQRVVIFHEFTEIWRWIHDRMLLIGRKPVAINGEVSNHRKPLDAFKAGEADTLIAQTKAAAQGPNWQFANYCVLYEPTSSPDVYDQAISRLHRLGQRHPVVVAEIESTYGYDEKIRQYRDQGLDLHQCIIEGEVSL